MEIQKEGYDDLGYSYITEVEIIILHFYCLKFIFLGAFHKLESHLII